MFKYCSAIVLYVLIQTQVYAWNNLGHRVIAQIAYDNMDITSKRLFNTYNQLLNVKGRKYSLVDSAFWLDTLYAEKYKQFRKIHYIDIPFVVDKVKQPKKFDSYNAVFAVNMANLVLRDRGANLFDKAVSFRIMWHVVGDLHQPMHAVSRYSNRLPNGDRGGNLERLSSNKIARNLHEYWDRGAGFLSFKGKLSSGGVQDMVKNLTEQNSCATKDLRISPEAWAKESYDIAVSYAYKSPVDHHYQVKAQEIVKQRLVLAGCRLAAMSNAIAAGDVVI